MSDRLRPRIAIWPLIARSYAHVARHPGLLARIGWFWFLLALAADLAVRQLATGGMIHGLGDLADLPFVIAFAVAWHRATLLDEKPEGWIAGHLGRREMRYAGWVLLLMLGALVIVVAGAMIVNIVVVGASGGLQIAVLLVLLFAVIWLAIRFILVLPAVALGNAAAGLRWSWRLTKGHGGSLFLAFCAVSLPLLLVKYGLTIAVGAPLLTGDSPPDSYQLLIWQPLFRLLDFVNMAVSIAFMSFAYAVFIRG